MNRNLTYTLVLHTRIVNYAVLNLAFIAAAIIRFRSEWLDVFSSNHYIALLLFVNLVWIISTAIRGYYKPAKINLKQRRRILLFLQVAVLHLIMLLAFNGLIKTYYSRLFLIYFYLLFFLLIPLTELMVRKLNLWYQRKIGASSRLVFAGSGQTVRDLAYYFEFRTHGYQQQQVIHIDSEKEDLIEKVKSLHKEQPLNELFCSAVSIPESTLQQLGAYCENNLIRIRLVLDYPKWETKPLDIVTYDSIPVVIIPVTPLDDPGNKLVKRLFDITFSLFVIVFVLSWLFPIVAALIKLTSKGPVLFKQKRTGLDNRQFDCWKFRSMRVNETADLVQATQNDPRITTVGRFIRKTSLDELPQFFNVLKGDMSVVGPRPHMLKHTEEYASRVGQFMQRHAIRPGVTGLAQVKGYRGEIKNYEHLANRVKYDRFYVENWSLALDLKIVLLTALLVVRPNTET